ncbi:hypothetical protein FIBSPDRAFT_928066 [Athelia psychrophila]|uniref:Uncharacterized protein n=1 Tax=Athelia psychrophila TaxID=1759441 RepID=A0A166QU93_9AGAM|nr:hypothetical protein FIBSPDRAFT_928066 [Fibularhizoctonia sp. CBS 109695]
MVSIAKTSFRFPPYCVEQERKIAFPAGSRGFVYLANADEPHSSWQIRFRVTGSDSPEGFESGTDILLPNQRPWSVALRALGERQIAALWEVLVRDGSVGDTLVNSTHTFTNWYIQAPPRPPLRELLIHDGFDIVSLAEESKPGNGPKSKPLIHSLGQLFRINLEQQVLLFGFVGFGADSQFDRRTRSPLSVNVGRDRKNPYATHSAPTSTQPDTLALRIVEMSTPVATAEPNYAHLIPMPQVDDLVMRYTRAPEGIGKGVARTVGPRPWTLDARTTVQPVVQAILRGKSVR